MAFKSDNQRKAFFANQGNIRADINPALSIKAKRTFGTTQNPLESGFITRKGKFIKLKEHKSIRTVFRQKHDNYIDKFLNQTGNLRIQVTDKQSAVEAKRKLTPKQIDAIRKTQLNSNTIYFDFNQGTVRKTGKFRDFANFKNFINRNNLMIKNGI